MVSVLATIHLEIGHSSLREVAVYKRYFSTYTPGVWVYLAAGAAYLEYTPRNSSEGTVLRICSEEALVLLLREGKREKKTK